MGYDYKDKKRSIQDRKLHHVKFLHDKETHHVEVVTVGAYSYLEAYQKGLKIFQDKGYDVELMPHSLRYNGPYSHRVFI